MSTFSPMHSFSGHAFTSTIYDRKTHENKFNYWIVIMTGMTFFGILSWYNFFLVLFNYILGTTSISGQNTKQQLITTFGYAMLWTIFVIIFYLVATKRNLLLGNPAAEFHDSSRVLSDPSIDIIAK